MRTLAAASVTIAACALWSCGDGSSEPNAAEVAKAIRPQLAEQLSAKKIDVQSLTCAEPKEYKTTCTAKITGGSTGQSAPLPIDAKIAKGTGKVTWTARRTAAGEFTADGGPPGTDGSDPVYAWTLVSCEAFDVAGADWYRQAAKVEGDYTASQSPNLPPRVARAAWERAIRRACASASNPTYQPVSKLEEKVNASLAARGY